MLSITSPTDQRPKHAGSTYLNGRDESVGGGAIGTSDFARGVLETALSKYEADGERLRGLAPQRHSHNALRTRQNYIRRFGHFARPVLSGLGIVEGYGDTVVTFIERADNATLDVAAEILGLPVSILPCTLVPRCLFPYDLEA
jgi:hypothetical protein